MPDTQRSLSVLLTDLFVDGQAAGAITPQDARDLIDSLTPPYGGFSFTSAVATTIGVQGTMVKALGTTTSTNLRNFTMPSNNRLTYIGVPDRHMHIAVSISFTTSGNNDDISLAVAKNGVVVEHSKLTRFLATGMDHGATAIHADFLLSTNGFLELFVTNEDSTSDVTIQQGYVFAMGMIV
jgi:hypothetical protein